MKLDSSFHYHIMAQDTNEIGTSLEAALRLVCSFEAKIALSTGVRLEGGACKGSEFCVAHGRITTFCRWPFLRPFSGVAFLKEGQACCTFTDHPKILKERQGALQEKL